MTNLYGNYKHRFMHILSLRPHTAFMLGGWTERDKYDVQNFWLYNQESYKFEKSYRYLQTEMYAGQWALASPHYRATQATNTQHPCWLDDDKALLFRTACLSGRTRRLGGAATYRATATTILRSGACCCAPAGPRATRASRPAATRPCPTSPPAATGPASRPWTTGSWSAAATPPARQHAVTSQDKLLFESE